ncbi:DEAD/DEAH box helicase [Brevibacillus brevis]|uniref:DEAD/DEAH box helicase n=1 Tax=Brevibacillus brevis TaxID=1393 RepID=UPI0025A4EA52|nr:DEAD/DEAH box helicase [Brevibacillus brevis]WJQ80204.1 DEAD/DEAH box helicase [Brevibacillus brevis]
MVDFYESLSEKIYNNELFLKTYIQLCKDVTLISLKQKNESALQLTQIKKLIETAGIFALASDSYKEIALKILNGLLICGLNEEAVTPVKLVLSRLGNFPTANLLQGYIDFNNPVSLDSLDYNLRNEVISKYIKNYLRKDVILTDFQSDLLKKLANKESISFSAPTSAGKTFVLTEHVCRTLNESKGVNVCIIVPTKALISQLFMDFSERLEIEEIRNTNIITTTAQLERLNTNFNSTNNIFILTQERLQYLLFFNPNVRIKFDILIVDEAQKIGDDSRGIILESTILEVIKRNPAAQIICSAPLAKNPERFSLILNHSQQVIKSDLSPVPQFIYDVRIYRKKLHLKIILDGKLVDVENNITLSRPKGVYKELAFIANYLGKEEMNIIFANGPSAAVKLADALLDYTCREDSDEVEEFVEYLKDEIHPLYKLVKYLSHGIAFHYSSMPLTIRNKVEELYKLQKLRYLCCTSTLLEGVNLPARNIFIQNPQEGHGVTMSDESFWNLVGRAGRLRKEFAGSIFCVNTHDWDNDLFNSKKNYLISSALERVISEFTDDFLNYLENYDQSLDKGTMFESSTSTFVRRILSNPEDNVANYVKQRDLYIGDHEKIFEMDRRVNNIIKQLKVPVEILQRNSTIDPRKQQKLLDHFLNNIQDLNDFLPIHPKNRDFLNNITFIFKNIDNVLVGINNNSHKYLAFIAMLWINEKPLKEIIINQIGYRTKNKSEEEKVYYRNDEKFVNELIEDIIDTINDKLVFHYARFTQCYIDILNLVLKQLDKEEIDYALPVSIEYGTSEVSSQVTISKGGSRSLAIRLSAIFKTSTHGNIEFVDWVIRNKRVILDYLPKSMHEEFLSVF